MNYNEARAVVAAGRHLPDHFAWLVREAEGVVWRAEHDAQWLMRHDQPTISPQQREQINMALAMRLAIACGKLPEWRIEPIRVLPPTVGELTKPAVMQLGVGA